MGAFLKNLIGDDIMQQLKRLFSSPSMCLQIVCMVILLFTSSIVHAQTDDIATLAKEYRFPEGAQGRSGYWSDESVCGKNEPSQIDGVFHISTPQQLGYVAWEISYMNDAKGYKNAQFVLDADLDMSGHFWGRIPGWGVGNCFRGSFDGQGHTISNLYCVDPTTHGFPGSYVVHNADHGGSFIGNASSSTFKNITFYHFYADGGRFTGLVGASYGDMTFENVHLVRCGLSTNVYNNSGAYGGGFIGMANSVSDSHKTITISNCSSDLTISSSGWNIGGFIGSVGGLSTVKVTNSVSYTNGNNYFEDPTIKIPLDETPAHHSRGGFVGALFGKVFFDLNNVAAYTEKDEQCMMQCNPQMTQYGVGGAFSSYIATGAGDLVSINGQNLFVDANAADYSYTDLCRFTMGVGCNMQFSTIRPIIPSLSKEHDQSLPTIVTLNESGMRMGVQYYDGSYYAVPLTDSIGCLVRYSPVSGAVSVSDYLSEQLQEKASITTEGVGQSGYLNVGRWAQYTVSVDDDHWVMADTTSTMTSKERLDAKTFKGTPTAGGKLGFEVSMRPRFRWVSHQYNVTKQQTTLCWQKHDGIDLKAWKDRKAQFYIYRNGIRVDSLSFNTESDNAYTWTDKEPKTGTINQYEVKVVCPQVFYTTDDNLTQLVCDVDCSGLGSVKTSTSGESGSIKVMVDVPNSVAYDSCHVTVRKYILSDLDNIQLNDSTADSLGQQVFRYNAQAADSTLRLTFTDNASTTPCVKWVYQAQCYHFSPKSDAAGTSQWGNAVELLPVTNFSISSISSSKGESTNKIAVSWKVNRGGAQGAVRYALSRKLYKRGEGTLSAIEDSTGWKEIYTVTNTSTENSYTDEVLPGYVYKYMVKAYPSCDGTYAENIYQAATTIGFAASRGTIMGRITYEGNTAVQGVDVRLTSETSAFSQKGGSYSLYFDGTPATLPLVPGLGEKFWKDNWTLSFLLLPVANGDQTSPVLALPGRFAITYGGNKLYMGSQGAAMTLPSEGKYSNILLRHDKKAGTLTLGYTTDAEHNDTIAHWSTPISDADLMAALPSALSTYTDTLLFGGGYRGYLDEVRLWDGALTEAQIANSYNRYLSGNEEGLEAYYTFDAGVDEYAFDTSHPAGKWNNHHTTIPNIGHPALTDDCVPTEDLLTYRGTTDKNGEYQISGVPFVGEGSNYQVVPIMGTHSFTPSSTRRYISQQSLNYSDVNFTDNSSFVVPVQAQYIYGSIPAEGLNVYVDGVVQTDIDYKPITTDKNGAAQVSVPIGRHIVTLLGFGHTMVNKGQACQVDVVSSKGICHVEPVSKDRGYLDFQRDLTSPLMFYDSTLVRVVGRVAGGKDEASKPVGFGQGQANLGAYNIVLEPNVAGYLNTTSYDKLEIIPDTIKSINSLTLFSKNNATITTDSVNGEYVALLPPVKWKINSVTAQADGDADIDLTKLNTLFTIDINEEQGDTLWTDSVHNPIDTTTYKLFTYNKRLDFIKYNNPVLTILNVRGDVEPADSLMLGERKIEVAYIDENSNNSVADSILLWRTDHAHDATMASYLTGYPVFVSGKEYKLRFKLFEAYQNHTTHKISQVPVRGAELEICNKWTSGQAEKLSTGDFQIIDDEEQTNSTEQTNAGIAEYSFEAGLPNTLGNFRLPMTITYTVNGTQISQSYEAYVTGGFQTYDGNNFVTEGPSQVFAVIMDPPGSGSSAYLAKGSTMSLSSSNIAGVSTVVKTEKKHTYGMEAQLTTLLDRTLKKIFSNRNSKIENDNFDLGYTFNYNGNQTYTVTLTDKVSTGTDVNHVGANGDVYMGISTNLVFASARYVNFRSVDDDTKDAVTSCSGHKYLLQTYDGMGAQTRLGTSFTLSQYDIVNIEIPLLKKMREAIIPETHYVDQLPSSDAKQDALGNRYNYYVLKSSRDKELWEENKDYVSIAPNNLAFDEFVVDSVNLYNEKIRNWQNIIASVEQRKYQAFQNKEKKHYADGAVNIDYGYLTNKTFDAAGAKVDESLTIAKSSSSTYCNGTVVHYKSTSGISNKFDQEHANTDFEFTIALDVNALYTHESKNTETYNTGIGYTLTDADLDDRFSVDVYLDGYVDGDDQFVPTGYLYNLVAGQTRNPWEGPTQSLYYKVGGESVPISSGSLSLDVPTMTFGTRNITNVPSGSTATVELNIGNASTGVGTCPYYSYTLYDINEDAKGIIAQIDGAPLHGYSTVLKPGTAKTIAVTFKQTDPNVLDYENLTYQMKLKNSAYDTISIHFTPMASPITLTSNDGLVLNGEKDSQRMLMKLTGYHPEYSKFAGVRLQYRKKDYDTWTTQMYLINDSALYASSRGTMPEKWRKLASDQDSVWLDMTDLADGEYLVRAQTFSILGNEELTACSEEVGILKDTTPLQVFGSPRPLSGIYAPGEEISITFNKPINTAKITNDNFLAKAAVNDAPYNHYCGLHFDGDNPAYTTSRINLMGTSSAIGLWYKPQVGKRSCLLSQMVTDAVGNLMPFRIWYNEDATMTVELFGQTYTSKAQATIGGEPCTDWMYLMFRHIKGDNGIDRFTLNNGYGTASEAESNFLDKNLARSYIYTDNTNVPLYVGGSEDNQNCYAEMQGLIIYNNESTIEKMYADKDSRTSDNVRGLAAYWPMDEGYGNKVADKVRSRDLYVDGLYHWYLPYTNYALHLNGKDQYVILNTENCNIEADADYVLETLFRTAEDAKGKHMTIFSNGWGGEGSTEHETNLPNRLSLALNESGAIEFNFAGRTTVMGSGYADNQWHHLALNVHRDGYVTVAVDTVNISSAKPVMGNMLGSFENSRMTIGARRYKSQDADTFAVADFFDGDIDEVRIWNANRTQAAVNHNFLLRLSGDELGLAAYYPFERTRQIATSNVIEPTIADCVTDPYYHNKMPQMVGFQNADDSTEVAKEATTSSGACLKPYLVESQIGLKYATSVSEPNRLILDFADYVKMSALQGCSVNLTVDDLMDNYGNYQEQSLSWNIYVDARDVRWQNANLDFDQQVGQDAQETTIITNSSNTRASWTISNIPSWLSVSPTSGTLGPKEQCKVTIKTVNSTPIGQYAMPLLLSSDLGVDDKCIISLTVTGTRPNWEDEFKTSDESMTIKAGLKIKNQWSTDPNSLVAVFDVNGKCHGVASPVHDQDMDRYFVDMTIHGDMPQNNRNLVFRVWDAMSGLTYSHVFFSDSETPRTDSLAFIRGFIHGNYTYPALIETSDIYQQTFALHKGWNWVSNWVQPTSNDINEIFQKDKGIVTVVKRRIADAGNAFDPSESYHLYAEKDGEISVEGQAIKPETVAMHLPAAPAAGKYAYQWIGYPVDRILTLDEAFSDFKPVRDDIVKAQDGYAIYNGVRWTGSFTFLQPSKGYIYARYGSEVNWHYPSLKGLLTVCPAKRSLEPLKPLSHQRFTTDYYRFPANMVAVEHLQVDGGNAPGWQVGAYIDGQCRGWAVADSTSSVFMTIAGDADGLVTYRACNTLTGAVIAVREQHPYCSNDVLGQCDSPYLLQASTTSHYVIPDDLPYSFQDYTYVTATVLDAGEVAYAHDYELGAFYHGELRGAATARAGEQCPIAIYGKDMEEYTFKLWDKTTLQEIDLVGTKLYDDTTAVQSIILRTPDAAAGIEHHNIDTDADGQHKWYDVGGATYGDRKPQKQGVYIRDRKKEALHR